MGKSQSKLSPDQIQYLENETCFNVKEIKTWYRDFKKECPKGGLTKEQFLNIFRAFHPKGDPAPFASYVFNVFDIDQNGQIEFEEFLRSLSITTRGRMEERLSWAFSLYDINKDGVISYEEMYELVSALYKMMGDNHQTALNPDERVQKIFELMDPNRDGLITEEEFTTCSLQNPDLLNTFLMYQGLV